MCSLLEFYSVEYIYIYSATRNWLHLSMYECTSFRICVLELMKSKPEEIKNFLEMLLDRKIIGFETDFGLQLFICII